MQKWFAQDLTIYFKKRQMMYLYHERVSIYFRTGDQGADMIKPINYTSHKLPTTNEMPVLPVHPVTSGNHNANTADPEAPLLPLPQ